MTSTDPSDALILELASFEHRPRDFVIWAFPWGEEGELATRSGAEKWQDDALTYLQTELLAGRMTPSGVIAEALQIAIRSGHDIGKSAFVCWIILWAISTREDTKGVVTANTEKQLRLKLWAELSKWHRLFIGKQFFRVTATSIQSTDPDREREWRIDAIPWSEENTEGFQGLHNYGKRVIVIFDEASGIVDKIWEAIDGVMNESNTELIWIATGNPTRNIGRFRDCFDPDGQGQFWKTFRVDSREVSFTNKERIQRAIDLWGVDSDYIKVRWLGEFPESGSNQLIPSNDIRDAMHGELQSFHYEPLILAVDVARYGDNESVAVFRRGRDTRTIPVQRYRKLSVTDLGAQIANLIAKHQPDGVFIDQGGVGGGVVDFLRYLGHSCVGVDFGGIASIPLGGERAYNKRAEMYLSLRTWLHEGGKIENSTELHRQLVSIEYHHSKAGKMGDAILLTPKEEMDDSPDWADALAMTFAFPVAKKNRTAGAKCKVEYDPLGWGALPTQRELDQAGGYQ